MNRADRILSATLIAVGLVFIFGIWPLTIVWPSGWSWHPAQGELMGMMIGLYATLGVFLLLAARKPREYLGLIWFTVWSSAVHGGIMAVQAVGDPEDFGHLFGDVPALLIVAGALAVLTRNATGTASAGGRQSAALQS